MNKATIFTESLFNLFILKSYIRNKKTTTKSPEANYFPKNAHLEVFNSSPTPAVTTETITYKNEGININLWLAAALLSELRFRLEPSDQSESRMSALYCKVVLPAHTWEWCQYLSSANPRRPSPPEWVPGWSESRVYLKAISRCDMIGCCARCRLCQHLEGGKRKKSVQTE